MHFIWRYKKYDFLNLKTTDDVTIVVLDQGQYNSGSGPDFFNAQLIIGDQRWAGNIEMHLRSSDWYAHHHHIDHAYDNVILHVVWEDDVQVYGPTQQPLPTLLMKSFVNKDIAFQYSYLLKSTMDLACHRFLKEFEDSKWELWLSSLFIERLQDKVSYLQELLEESINNWEEVYFKGLMHSFGLNSNADQMRLLTSLLPFSVVIKLKSDVIDLLAVSIGVADLWRHYKSCVFYDKLMDRWIHLRVKYKLKSSELFNWGFFKHRPGNFPTVRLIQCVVYYVYQSDFNEKIIKLNFSTPYKLSKQEKVLELELQELVGFKFSLKLTNKMIALLSVNLEVPLAYLYAQHTKSEVYDVVEKSAELPPEDNSVTRVFENAGKIPRDAMQSQALITLYKQYCLPRRCLDCRVALCFLGRGEVNGFVAE